MALPDSLPFQTTDMFTQHISPGPEGLGMPLFLDSPFDDGIVPDVFQTQSDPFCAYSLSHIGLISSARSPSTSPGRDTFMHPDGEMQAPYLDPSLDLLCPGAEQSTMNEYQRSSDSNTRRAFVEAKILRDKRPLAVQEKRRDASIDYFLQRNQTDGSQSQVNDSLEPARHKPRPSWLARTLLNEENQSVSTPISKIFSSEIGHLSSDDPPLGPFLPPSPHLLAHSQGQNERNVVRHSKNKNKFDARLIESVWTPTFEPYKVRTLRPKTRTEQEACNWLRRNGGACDKHRKAKKPCRCNVSKTADDRDLPTSSLPSDSQNGQGSTRLAMAAQDRLEKEPDMEHIEKKTETVPLNRFPVKDTPIDGDSHTQMCARVPAALPPVRMNLMASPKESLLGLLPTSQDTTAAALEATNHQRHLNSLLGLPVTTPVFTCPYPLTGCKFQTLNMVDWKMHTDSHFVIPHMDLPAPPMCLLGSQHGYIRSSRIRHQSGVSLDSAICSAPIFQPLSEITTAAGVYDHSQQLGAGHQFTTRSNEVVAGSCPFSRSEKPQPIIDQVKKYERRTWLETTTTWANTILLIKIRVRYVGLGLKQLPHRPIPALWNNAPSPCASTSSLLLRCTLSWAAAVLLFTRSETVFIPFTPSILHSYALSPTETDSNQRLTTQSIRSLCPSPHLPIHRQKPIPLQAEIGAQYNTRIRDMKRGGSAAWDEDIDFRTNLLVKVTC